MFGVIIVVATVYDVLTTASLQTVQNPSLNFTEDRVGGHHSLITDQHPPVFGAADDVLLISESPNSHVYGSCSFLLLFHSSVCSDVA